LFGRFLGLSYAYLKLCNDGTNRSVAAHRLARRGKLLETLRMSGWNAKSVERKTKIDRPAVEGFRLRFVEQSHGDAARQLGWPTPLGRLENMSCCLVPAA